MIQSKGCGCEGVEREAGYKYVSKSHLFICACVVCTCVGMCIMEEVWRSEDSFGELDLFFYHMEPGDRTQTARFSSKSLYQLSCLDSPQSLFKGWFVRRIRALERKIKLKGA